MTSADAAVKKVNKYRTSSTAGKGKMKNLSNIVKNIDAYPKTLEDFTIKTFSGAIGIVGK